MAVQNQRMLRNVEFQHTFDHILYIGHAGVAKLLNFAAIEANQVVVLFEAERLFVQRLLGAKLMFYVTRLLSTSKSRVL